MATKSDKRRQTSEKLLRMLPIERAYLDAAAAKASERLREEHPGAKFGLTNFILGAALKDAQRELGMSLAEWEKQRGGRRKENGR